MTYMTSLVALGYKRKTNKQGKGNLIIGSLVAKHLLKPESAKKKSQNYSGQNIYRILST